MVYDGEVSIILNIDEAASRLVTCEVYKLDTLTTASGKARVEWADLPGTPLPKCNPVDTPRTAKSLNAHDQPLEVIRSRQAVAMQGEVAEVDIEKFVDYYLPFHPDNDVIDTAVECLVESGNLRKQQDGEVWTKFDGVEDSDEDARFNRLIPIFEVLQGLKVGHRERTCGFRRDPNRTTASEISGSAHKVDGYLGLMKSTMPVSSLPVSKEVPTADVAVNCEFKLDPKKRPDNRRKVLYSAGHAMNNDPCRRFMYSVHLPIRTFTMRSVDQHVVAMSTLFDFTANPRLFISIMIAFLFATPQELGYDDDIKRVWDDTGIQYVYHIDDLYLKTVRCLDEPFGLCITGRATRVWEAKKVKSFVDLTPIEQSTVVVRDVWLDVSTKTERQIQQEIFSALDDLYKDGDPPDDDPKFDGEEDAKRRELIDCVKDGSFRSYFLTILADKEGDALRNAYIYRKHELTEDYTYSYLYNAARECLEQCRVHNTTVEVLPLPRPKLGVPSKRSGRCKRRQAPPADDADYEPPLKRIQVSDSQSSIGSSPDDGE
ncbi:hypothetical protein FRB99_005381 [Tulasnella sp. 403]|nr:hypothetical protein FRB99_005381 [Tulasnella sp. 403]